MDKDSGSHKTLYCQIDPQPKTNEFIYIIPIKIKM